MPSTRPQRPYNVAYYARNREAEIARVTIRQQATLAWLRELRQVPCMDCGGVFPPHVMDFDHRDPKAKSFSLLADHTLLKSRAVLEAEIAKCDIVCANCHRIRTATQVANGDIPTGFRPSGAPPATVAAAKHREAWHRRRREQMDVLIRLRQLPCMDCGKTYPVCAMEFDHRNGAEKAALVSQLPGRVKIATLLEEIAKCDIVCTNCHRDRSFRRRFEPAGVAQLARATAFQAVGRGFETRLPLSTAEQLRLIEEPSAPYHYAA